MPVVVKADPSANVPEVCVIGILCVVADVSIADIPEVMVIPVVGPVKVNEPKAKEVAQEILTRAGKNELYIILPKAAYKMWLLKRLAPVWFRKKVAKEFMAAMNKVIRRSK